MEGRAYLFGVFKADGRRIPWRGFEGFAGLERGIWLWRRAAAYDMEQRGPVCPSDMLLFELEGIFMTSRWRLTSILAVVTVTTTLCSGQSATRPSGTEPGIDSAVMAKAKAGNAEAEFKVGAQYELGAHVTRDPVQAAQWYRKAADQGFAQAEHSLGILYEFGNGVAADPATAAQWYRKAAEQGFAPAQFSLGLCYVHGKGVPQDFGQALAWYGKAAAQKNSDALLNLAFFTTTDKASRRTRRGRLTWCGRLPKQGRRMRNFNWGWTTTRARTV